LADRSLWAHENSELEPDPNVIWGKLDNGFRYAVMVNRQPSDRVSVHLNIQAGSLHEGEAERGFAHFLEHMLFNGTTHFPPGEIVKYFQSIGMQFGPDANAHTGMDETVYHLVLPDGKKETLEQGFRVMMDYAQGALLLNEEIERERKVVLAEKRTRDSASYRIFEASMKFEFPDSIISRRLPIGDETVLGSAGRQQLKGFYDTWYRPETMILIAVGDVDPAMTVELIQETFSPMTARAPAKPEPDLGGIRHSGTKVFYHFEEEIGSAAVGIETIRMTEAYQDSYGSRRLQLVKDVAARMIQNRLDEIVRTPGSPLTAAYFRAGRFLGNIESAEITGKSLPENWENALHVVEQELRKALLFGFTASELQRVRKEMINELSIAVEKASTRESRDLAMQIIHDANSGRVFLSPQQAYAMLVPVLERLDVQEVHRAFTGLWGDDHRLVMVSGTAPVDPRFNPPDHHVRSVYEQSTGIRVAKPLEDTPVVFPYLSISGSPGTVISRNYLEDLEIHQVDFENGLRLNAKRTTFKAKEVLLKLAFGEGLKSEPENRSGLGFLAASVINESGLGVLTSQELERALAGKNTEVSFEVEEDHFVFNGSTVTEEIPLMFQLLHAHLVDPAFRDNAYALVMERFQSMYDNLSRSVDGGMRLAGNRFLAGGDGRFGLPEKDRFFSLSLEDVRNWIQPIMEHAPLEISVVGDFDLESLVKTVGEYMGSLPLREHAVSRSQERGPQFPNAQELDIPVATSIPKSLVVVAYPTDDYWDIYRTRRLSVLSEVLSDRLRERIREKMGAAYTSYAFNRPSRAFPGYGVLQAVVHADPGETKTVGDEILKIVNDLIEHGVGQDELRRALEPTLTGIRELRQKNTYWLGSVLNGSGRHPEQLEWSRSFLADYSAITAEELDRLARQYLDPRHSARITVRPSSISAGFQAEPPLPAAMDR
jgi:zinc protease